MSRQTVFLLGLSLVLMLAILLGVCAAKSDGSWLAFFQELGQGNNLALAAFPPGILAVMTLGTAQTPRRHRP